MLNVIVESLDDVPEGAREHYQERDGKFELDLTGAFSQIDRDNLQESLRKEREVSAGAKGTVKLFGEWTPEKVAELETQHDQLTIEVTALKKEGGPTGEDVDKLVEARVMARIAPVERNLQRVTAENVGLKDENGKLVSSRSKDTVLREVLGAFSAKDLGANVDARPDVELWANGVFEVLEGGEVVSRDGVGLTPGLKPADILKDMKDQGVRRHWFGLTKGAGAGGGGGSPDTGDNPFTLDKESGKVKNLTQAAKMVRDDRARAKRLASAAKVQHLFPSLFPN
jgi:hypothetical protein